jgi:hypothetical protein
MRVLASTCGSRRDLKPMGGLANAPRALVAAAEECDAPVPTGMMPTGV